MVLGDLDERCFDDFHFNSAADVLNSLRIEINLKEEEKHAYLESILKKDDISPDSLGESGETSYEDGTQSSDTDSATGELDNEPFVYQEDAVGYDSWNKFSLDSEFWKVDELAGERPISYDDLKLKEKEKAGILTQRIVSVAVSHLTQLPGRSKFVFTKLHLPNKGLVDISVLGNYKDLMYVDLSDNKIRETGVFSNMNYLVYLNLSYNQINVLDVEAAKPIYLTYLNLSHNQIEEIPSLDSLWSLTHLDLSNNKITSMTGLWSLRYLCVLNLSNNFIQAMDVRLFAMNLRNLYLSHNKIKDCSGDIADIIVAQTLVQLDVSYNRLTSLQVLETIYWLEELNISFNNIKDLNELNFLRSMKRLETLSVDGNKLCEISEVKGLLIYLVPSLSTINSVSITETERVLAADLYNNSLLERAFQLYSNLLVKRYSKEPLSDGMEPTLRFQACDKDIVLIVGPPGSYKWEVITNICAKYPDYVIMGRLVTTLKKPGKHMEHVSMDRFNWLINTGRVITYEYRLGAGFALCWEDVRREVDGQVILVGLELSAALCMYWQGLATTLILTMTKDPELHFERIKALCKDYESEHTLKTLISDSFVQNSNELLSEETSIFSQAKERPMPYMDIENMADTRTSINTLLTEQEDYKSHSTLGVLKESDSASLNSTAISDIEIYRNPSVTSSNKTAEMSNINFTLTAYGSLPSSADSNQQSDELRNSSLDEQNESIHQSIHTPKKSSSNDFRIAYDNVCSLANRASWLEKDIDLSVKSCDRTLNSSLSICLSGESAEEEEEYIDEDYLKYQLFIDSVMKSRDEYIDIHHNMPGLFCSSVITDNVNESVKKITTIIHKVYANRNKKNHKELFYKPTEDPMYEEIVKQNINNLMKTLTRTQYVSSLIPIVPKKDPLPNKTNFYFNK